MPLVVVLDSGPLSNSAVPPARQGKVPTLSQQCRQWISDCERSGVVILVSAVCYYETLGELERRGATRKIRRLKEFVFGSPERFVPLTTRHLETAARMWAETRSAGKPFASDDSLDADVIVCAQALSLGLAPSEFVVATTNAAHLSRFVPCDEWANIKSGS